MKYINRWALMRNTKEESICEHSLETAVIAHALAVINNQRCGGSINPERTALFALFHDCAEIFTGDLPTPVKYSNGNFRSLYKNIENEAAEKLLGMLPDDLAPSYRNLLLSSPDGEDAEIKKLVKAADKISALIKCIEERKAGNNEFNNAKAATLKLLHDMNMPETEIFLREFLPAFEFNLDELGLTN